MFRVRVPGGPPTIGKAQVPIELRTTTAYPMAEAESDKTTGWDEDMVETPAWQSISKNPRVREALETVPWRVFAKPPPSATGQQADHDEGQEGLFIHSPDDRTTATMADQLNLELGMRVLQVGTGSGHGTAILSQIAGGDGGVVTIDIDERTAQHAGQCIAEVGFDRVEIVCGDGWLGWPKGAPYDRIQVTVGPEDVSPHWMEQLKEGGILVMPLWLRGYRVSVAFEKRGKGLHSRSLRPCMYSPIRSRPERSEGWYSVRNADGDVTIALDWQEQVDLENLSLLFQGENRERDLGRSPKEMFPAQDQPSGLFVCFTRDPGAYLILSQSDGMPFRGAAYAVIDTEANNATLLAESLYGKLLVYGDGPTHGRMLDLLDLWDRLGRPSLDKLRLDLLPEIDSAMPTGSWMIPKRSEYIWLLQWG